MAHVPHRAPASIAQKPVAHWAEKLHAPVPVPSCVVQAAGGALVNSSPQLSASIAWLHATTALGLFAVIGAARASVHASSSRVSHAESVPNRRAP